MAMGRSESHVREELLAASDEVIEDAIVHADLTALRGLLYQLAGDDEVARARLNADDPATALLGGDDDAELVRRKGVEFLKTYRDRGAGEIAIGPEERLPKSLRLASHFELADDDMAAITGLDRGESGRTGPHPDTMSWIPG